MVIVPVRVTPKARALQQPERLGIITTPEPAAAEREQLPASAGTPLTSTVRVRRCWQRRLAAGLCRDCGRRPLFTEHRCRICQQDENRRWRAAYPSRWHTIRRVTAQQRRQQRRIAQFLGRLERETSA
jgi:hypothetical protein